MLNIKVLVHLDSFCIVCMFTVTDSGSKSLQSVLRIDIIAEIKRMSLIKIYEIDLFLEQ